MHPTTARAKQQPRATPAPIPAFAPVLRPDSDEVGIGKDVCEAEVDFGADVLATWVVELVILLLVIEVDLAEGDERVDVDDVNAADGVEYGQLFEFGGHIVSPALAGSLKSLARVVGAVKANVAEVLGLGHEHGRADVTVLLLESALSQSTHSANPSEPAAQRLSPTHSCAGRF